MLFWPLNEEKVATIMPVVADKLEEQCLACDRVHWCGFRSWGGKECANIPPGAKSYDPTPDEMLDAIGGIYLPERYVRNMKRRKTKRPSPISFRLPQEVLDHFGKGTPGWQKRVVKVLLDFARTKADP
jgi:uncharacterized protein (DUF4415 family)